LLKERTAKHKEHLKDTENALKIVVEKIKLQTRHLNELQEIDQRNSKLVQNEIDELNGLIAKLNAENAEFSKQYETDFARIQKELTQQQKQQREKYSTSKFRFLSPNFASNHRGVPPSIKLR
jgi:hypothetical protein